MQAVTAAGECHISLYSTGKTGNSTPGRGLQGTQIDYQSEAEAVLNELEKLLDHGASSKGMLLKVNLTLLLWRRLLRDPTHYSAQDAYSALREQGTVLSRGASRPPCRMHCFQHCLGDWFPVRIAAVSGATLANGLQHRCIRSK